MKKSPLHFLIGFLPAAAVLLVGWTYISDLYLASILGGVNFGLWMTNASIYLNSGDPVGSSVACPDIIAAVALFAVIPGYSLRRRLLSMGVTISALWLLQGLLIFLEIHLAAQQVANLEMLALVRSWGSPALILMLWVGFSGSFVGVKAQEKCDEQSEPVDKKSSIKTQEPRPTARTASKKSRTNKAHLPRQRPKKRTGGLYKAVA